MRKIFAVIIVLFLLSSLSYAAQDRRDVPQQMPQQQGPISSPTVPSIPPQANIPNMPNMPAQVPMPNITAHTMMPQVPMIGNTIGEVVNKGKEKNGQSWLEVRDNLFDQVIRIKIRDLKNTPIAEQAERRSFEDINIKDMVNVIFTNDNQDNIANFISIMTEEEAQLYTGTPISEQPATTDETKK